MSDSNIVSLEFQIIEKNKIALVEHMSDIVTHAQTILRLSGQVQAEILAVDPLTGIVTHKISITTVKAKP